MSLHTNLAGFATFISPINDLSVGVVTATQLYGDGSEITGVGLGSTSSISTSGIVTAGRFSGDGSELTDVGGYLAGLIYSPSVSETNVGLSSNISITFNKHIVAVGGTITLRTDSPTGTIVESFNVGTSSSISISGATLTVNPTNNLTGLTTYYLVVPDNVVEDTFGTGGNLGISSYFFESRDISYTLYAFGYNIYGQLGQSNRTSYSSPVQIPGVTWSSISANNISSLGTKTDGTLWAWGANNVGQLGQNSTTYISSPVQIPGTTWSSISGGYDHSMAFKTDGTLWTWGNGSNGKLGQNTIISQSSPVQIPGTTWSSIATGYYQSAATKTDGTLWAWGYNYIGQLGQNSRISRSSPVQIPGTSWSTSSGKIGYINSQALSAIKNDGTLWSWGSNFAGSLGQNNTINYSSPVQIPGTTWNLIGNGGSISNGGQLALKTDGTLWAWGYNTQGQLGQGDSAYRSSPIQIPGTTWSSVSNGYRSLATKTDGTLWSWGSNTFGQLGQNNRTQYNSPIQLPGTTWISIGGNGHSLAIKEE